jgi:hypothetical protein
LGLCSAVRSCPFPDVIKSVRICQDLYGLIHTYNLLNKCDKQGRKEGGREDGREGGRAVTKTNKDSEGRYGDGGSKKNG